MRLPHLPALLVAATAVLHAETAPRYLDVSAPVETRVRDLLGRMTPEEKIAQMDEYTVRDALKPENKATLSTIGIGSMLGEFDAKQYAEIRALTAKSRLKIPVLLGIDACHGDALYPGATVFPTNISVAATFDTALAHDTARLAAKEIRGWGHHWIFTPTLDVTRDQRFGRSGETFGESSFVTSEMAKAYVAGYQGAFDFGNNVAPALKELKGFARVKLAPGESKVVSFTVKPEQLALWNPAMKHVVEPGEFDVAVGDRKAVFTLTGTKDWDVK